MPVEHDERSNRFWPEYPCCVRVKRTDLSKSVNSQHHLVTAAHVLEEMIATNRLERINIQLGGLSAGVPNLGTCNMEPFKISDPFDAAIIRFEQPELIASLRPGLHFPSPTDLSPIRANSDF
jgi:hypothetical protein